MGLFDGRRAKHAFGKTHNAKTRIVRRVTWLVAVIASLATLLSGGIAATANSVNPRDSKASGASSVSGGMSKTAKSNQAGAQDGDPQYQFLNFSQSVYGNGGANAASLKPGDKFTYRFNLGCSETNCENASLTDQLPAALQGFAIVGFDVSPSLQANVMWKEGGVNQPSRPATIGSGTSFVLTPGQQFVTDDGNKTGLVVGMNGTVNLTLQVPANFSPSDPRNKTNFSNSATLSASNSKSVTSSAGVKVSVDSKLAAQATASFDPDSTTYYPGVSEALKLNVTNTSNINADKVVVQMPQDTQASADATSLDTNNPFRFFDFDSFGSTVMPTGATKVQVDAYVKGSNGKWNWVTGAPGTTFSLPTGINASDVAGLRFSFLGSMAPDATVASPIAINLKQRSTDRNDASNSPLIESNNPISVSSVAQANASQGSQTGTPTVAAPATVTLSPAKLGVTINETIDPARHPAGNKSVGTVVLTNGGSAVSKMNVAVGKNFFDSDIKFGGFKDGISYPAGADSGQVVYHMLDGSHDQTVTFGNGAIPAPPSGDIASFDLQFGSTPTSSVPNPIEANANAGFSYIVKSPSAYSFPDGQTTKDITDSTTKATVTAHNTSTASATADPVTMTLVKPQIHVTVDKEVNPTDSVPIDHDAVVAYQETTGASTDYLQPNTISVEDSWSDKTIGSNGAINEGTAGANAYNFWNVFNLRAIESTPIPAHTKLTVSVNLPGVGWVELDSKAAQNVSYLYGLNAADLKTKLDAAHSGATPDQVTGIRFKLEAEDGNDAFTGSTAISQYVSFTARSQKRDGAGPTDVIDTPDPQKPTKYTYGNTTSLAASGKTDEGYEVDSNALDADPGNQNKVGILQYRPPQPDTGNGFYRVDDWISATFTDPDASDATMDSVPSQSGKKVTAHLNWGVDGDMTSVTLKQAGNVTDYPDAGAHNDMWSDVFNLVSINPIAVSDTPYSNGWYLKYDKVNEVRVFHASTGRWTALPAPDGSWQNADHSFKGYVVPAQDIDDITGVEISVAPDDASRSADIAAGKNYVPQPGSGVAASGQTRDFSSNWQLRDKKRDGSAFVTGSVLHNGDSSHAQPQNIRLDAQRATAADPAYPDMKSYVALNGGRLDITDYRAAIKEGDGGTYNLLVPPHGVSAPTSAYPMPVYDLSATNDSPNRASYLRITMPAECDNSNQDNCYTANTPIAATSNPFTASRVSDIANGKLDSASTMPNIFNRQTLTHIDISSDDPSQVSLNDSHVYILRYTPTNYATGSGTFRVDPTITTAAQANAMTQAQLADVVAVSVTFQGSDPATTGGTLVKGNYVHLKLTTRVRDTIRSTNKPFVPSEEENNQNYVSRATAQIYAPITDSGPNDTPTKFVKDNINYYTGSLLTSINETINPNNLVNVDTQVPQIVSIDASSNNAAGLNSTLSPTKVTLTSWPDGKGLDGSSTKTGNVWKNFDFTGISAITFPAGATKVKIGVYGPFGAGGAMGWKDGDEQAYIAGANPAYELPVAAGQYDQVQGLRFVFTNPDNSGNLQLFSNSSDMAWNASIQYQIKQRQTVRGDDTGKVVYPGSEPNAVSSQAESKLNDGVNPDQSASADTGTPMTWGFGTADLGLDEVANYGSASVSVGQMVPWEVTIANTGTGYLNISKVTADLPAQLRYTGQGGAGDPAHPFTFTPGAVGGAPNSGELKDTPSFDSTDSSKIVLTWPSAKNRMLPGEVAKFVVWLEVEPGAPEGSDVSLPVTVNTEQHLDAVGSAPGGSAPVSAVMDGANTVGGKVTASVTPSSGEDIYIVGGVKGSMPGAINTLNASQTCEPTLTALDGKNYYRAPCRANTAVGGKDDWVLHLVNAGTTSVKKVQFFEQLPAKHDKSIVASSAYRGSTYHPELTGVPKVVGAPAGTTTTIEASTDTSPCVDTWNTLPGIASSPANEACSASAWANSSAVADWSKVTGLRVTLDFSTAADGALQPGKGADVTYTSKNAPVSSPGSQADDSDPSVPVSLDQTAGVQEAWDQFGILYTSADDSMHPAAPARFGTRIETGSLKVGKTVSGSAASGYTPQQVRASVSCRDADAAAMLFGGQNHGLIELDKQPDGTYGSGRLSGIPLSVNDSGGGNTVCTISEDGPLGQFGETERTVNVNGDNNTADSDMMDIKVSDTLDRTGQPTNAVAAAQSAKITNTYRYSGLSVTKKVDTKANKGSFGPFNFKAVCKTSDGQMVKFNGGRDDSVSFTLKDGETWKAPADTIPANSTCTITETDTSAADKTVFTGDNVTDNADGTASVRIGNGGASDIAHLVATTVTNHYDAGTLTVSRAVSGDGASRYGKVPVSFKAVCDYRDQQLLDEKFGLAGTSSKSFGVFPAGTQCTVTQLTDAGATKHVFLPKTGKVTIATVAKASAADAAAAAAAAGGSSSEPSQPSQPSGSSEPSPSSNPSGSSESSDLSSSPSSADEPTLPAGPKPGVPTLVNDLSSITVAEADRYDVSQVPIVLKRTGDESAVQSRGNGPFKVKATCTYQRGGLPTAIDLGGDGTFILNSRNKYSITLKDILLGAHCTIVQTDSAGADSTSIDPANGEKTVVESADKNTVTITDVFRDKPSLAGLAGGLSSGLFGAGAGVGSSDGTRGRSSMARTGAAVAGIVVLIIILLAGGAIIFYMRRHSIGGDESNAVLDSSSDSDDPDDAGNQDGSDGSADSDASDNDGDPEDSADSASSSRAN